MFILLSGLFYLLVFFPLVHAGGSFYGEIHKFKTAYGAHANADRIAHINSLAAADPDIGAPLVAAANPDQAVTSAFQIYTSSLLPTSPAPSAACTSALTASVSCDPNILYMAYPFASPSLASLCTATCTESLQAYRQAVATSCSGFKFAGPNNSTHAATLAIDVITNSYTIQCLKDGTTDDFCPTVLSTYINANPSQGILGYPQNQLCSSCVLGTIKTTLSNALTFSPPLYQTLQAALAICGSAFSPYNVSVLTPSPPYMPGAASLLGSTSVGLSTCAVTNRNVVVSVQGTCEQVAAQFSVATTDILASNPLLRPANCTSGIAAGTSLCLPQPCTIYPLQATQTCSDVVADVNQRNLAAGNKITISQLQSFNPSLGELCQLDVGARTPINICISPHGGFPTIGNDGGSAVPTHTPMSTTAGPPGPTPSGTTPACSGWYLVRLNDICHRILMRHGITLIDFQTLNPQVNDDCSNLWAGLAYCVVPAAAPAFTLSSIATGTIRMLPISMTSAPTTTYPSATPAPVPTNVFSGTATTGCMEYYTVKPGDTCQTVEDFFGIDIYPGNPGVICPTLPVGSAICIFTFDNPCELGASFTVFQQAFNSKTKKHFYTTSNAEMQQATSTGGFTFQDLAAGVFSSPSQPLVIPLFRLFIPATGGFSTPPPTRSENAFLGGGAISQGIAAYVWPTQLCGSQPMFRLFNPTTQDYLYTMFVSEKNTAKNSQGYTEDDGIPFYVWFA
ncbi:hypothetical protein B0H14DRAFT_2453139 [Mycena olivaceomarginata]|nr:hypothetical protein B0H14DRAFT_2453139 [Mycena olivaceomarginata]